MNLDERELLHNSIQCPDGTILVSRYGHDFVEHKQKDDRSYFVDGGLAYQRIGYSDTDYKDLSVYADDEHSVIREYFEWGRSYDADMNLLPETKYIKLKEITDDHLKVLVKWTSEDYPDKIHQVFLDEVKWRGLKEEV